MKPTDFDIGKPGLEVDPLPGVHAGVDDAVEHIRQRLHDLVNRLGLPRDATALRQFEVEAFGVVLGLLTALIGVVLRAAHAEVLLRLGASAAAREARSVRLRSRGVRAVTVRVYGGGLVGLLTPYCAVDRRRRRGRRRSNRGPTGSGVYPVLEMLGFVGHYSPAVAAEVARQVAECASLAVAKSTLATLGLDLDIKTIRWIAAAVADIDLGLREEAAAQVAMGHVPSGSEEFAGKRIAISVDGGRVRTREGGRRGRRRHKSHRRGFHAPWREPKAFVIYVIDSKGRMERKSLPVCDGTMGDANTVFAYLIAELVRRGAARASEIVLVADGAHWIWDRRELLAAALGIPVERITEVVDFYHVVEHLAEFAEGRLGTADRDRWLRRMRTWLRAERVDAIVAEVRRLAPRGSRELVGYLERNRSRMRYRDFRRRGLPLGSGAIESAIRRVVNQRIKACGSFWKPRNAERVLHLRAYLKAGRWDELVERVIHNTWRRAA